VVVSDLRTWDGDTVDTQTEPPAGDTDTESTERASSRPVLRLRGYIADPFSRNAFALILNTGLTGFLGIGFWWLAPRYYSEAVVGRGSALISVMTLLSGVVAINLTGTLSRFIPRAGRRTGRLVCAVYLLSIVIVVVLSGGFLLTLGHWGPNFDLLRDPVMALCFVPAVVIAGIFTIQDAVLTALRRSFWVPVENTCFGLIKIVLLVVLASALPNDGFYLSWVIAMVLLVPPISGLIFGRLLPRHGRMTGDHVVPPTRAQVGGFFAGDYVGALFVFAAGYLVPVIVAADFAPDDFAHFYLVWTVVGILNLVATNLATSMTVEGGYEAGKLATNCRTALRRALGILVVAVAALALVAHWAFGALGPGYLAALPALFALAFAALPRAVVEIWIGVLRAQGRARQVARVQIAIGVLVVGSVLAWLQTDEHALGQKLDRITGVGVAVLVSYAAVAIAVLPGLRRFMVESDAPRDARPSAARRLLGQARWPSRASVAVCVLTAAALIGYRLSLRKVDLTRIDGLGLISALPVTSLLCLALLTLAFGITLSFQRPRAAILGAQLVATLACLHGVAALIEPLPRFPTVWIHMGFVEYIGRTGTVLPYQDARFNWPGFFSLIAFVTGKHDWASMVGLLTWTPLLSNLLYLLPFVLLLRNLRASWRAKWFAAWLFCVLNWVGQDYFSPQGFTYLFYLVFIATLVTWFRSAGPDPLAIRLGAKHRNRGKTRNLVPGELPARTTQTGVRVTLMLLLVGSFVLATFSHQLTPFVMMGALTGLVLVRRCIATGLPWLLGVILTAYVSYLGAAYWAGHFGTLKAGLGDLIATLLAGTAGRAHGGSAEHGAVLTVRLAITVGVFAVAMIGAWRRRRRGFDDRVAIVLALAPLPALLETYGGEMVLRVYLFALPGTCVLAAYAFFPTVRSARRPWSGLLAAAVCSLVLVGGFLFARYGNEAYEMTRPGELAIAEYVYQHHASPVLFMVDTDDPWATPFIPLGYRDVEDVSFSSIRAPINPRNVDSVVAALRKLGPSGYLLTTRSQEWYVNSVGDYPRSWGDDFRESMRKNPQVRVVTANADAVLYALRAGPKHGPPVAHRGQFAGVRVLPTVWTPVGIFFLFPLILVLLVREVWRVCLGPGERERLLPLTLMAAPLFVVFVAVLIERTTVLIAIAPSAGRPESVCEVASAGVMQIGGGGTNDMLRLQQPWDWCVPKIPTVSVWSEHPAIGLMPN
jgi:O-antigen/teichoic acid export membrane protein